MNGCGICPAALWRGIRSAPLRDLGFLAVDPQLKLRAIVGCPLWGLGGKPLKMVGWGYGGEFPLLRQGVNEREVHLVGSGVPCGTWWFLGCATSHFVVEGACGPMPKEGTRGERRARFPFQRGNDAAYLAEKVIQKIVFVLLEEKRRKKKKSKKGHGYWVEWVKWRCFLEK